MFKFLKNLKESGDWKTILFHSSWSLTLGSGLSYFFGFVRDRILAQTFGLSRTLDIYNASFVGYFPADDPKYSCIVFVNRPLSGKIYGGSVAAPVFKEIADKVYASQLDIHDEHDILSSQPHEIPVSKGTQHELIESLEGLGYKVNLRADSEWSIANSDHLGKPTINAHKITYDLTPNVVGMSAKDALFIMEKLGYQVVLNGRGKVKYQSIPAGSRIKEGTRIKLDLATL